MCISFIEWKLGEIYKLSTIADEIVTSEWIIDVLCMLCELDSEQKEIYQDEIVDLKEFISTLKLNSKNQIIIEFLESLSGDFIK
jgi:hypothetical protein